jgi:hypothetical protein
MPNNRSWTKKPFSGKRSLYTARKTSPPKSGMRHRHEMPAVSDSDFRTSKMRFSVVAKKSTGLAYEVKKSTSSQV